MNKGIIYLIQPAELVGTNRYKIGCSKIPDLERCKNGYKKGSRYLSIMECIKPLQLEEIIKKTFNNKFKLIAGNEYYEGSEKEILEIFLNLVIEYYKTYNIQNKEINNNENIYDICESDNDDNEEYIIKKYINNNEEEIEEHIYKYIKDEFYNYIQDISFNGNKELIKIEICDSEINIRYIKCEEYQKYYRPEGYEFSRAIKNPLMKQRTIDIETIKIYDYYHSNSDNHHNYIKELVNNKIIENNKIYDMNDINFIKNIKKYMKKIVVYNSDNINKINEFFINTKFNIKDKIKNIFLNNLIINNNIYSYAYINNDDKYLYKIYCDINFNNKEKEIKMIKLNNIYYDYEYLRYNIPYQLYIGNKYFYILNRDYYDYNITKNDILVDKYSSVYLFNDGNAPWLSENNDLNIKKIINKYNELTNNKLCLNLTKDTKYLLNIFE